MNIALRVAGMVFSAAQAQKIVPIASGGNFFYWRGE